MDPALQELLEGNPQDEIEVIVRLHDPEKFPADFRIVSKFGPILTGRVLRRSIRNLWSSPEVASVKAPRLFQHDAIEEEDAEPTGILTHLPRRPSEPGNFTGNGVYIGVVDWGIDFTHPNFLHPDGSTRLEALWDQTSPYDPANNPFGYGKIYLKTALDAALKSETPFAALGYHPAIADPSDIGSHGTHVLDIAAGGGAIGPAGMAPGAKLLAAHLSADQFTQQIGTSCHVVEACDFFDRMAGVSPLIINLSMGKHCGPHTGLTLVEQALDYLSLSPYPRVIVQSAGNYYRSDTHTSGLLLQDETRSIGWDFPALTPHHHHRHDLPIAGMQTKHELEIWYSGEDDIAVSLIDPTGRISAKVSPGGSTDLYFSNDRPLAGRIYNRRLDPNTGFNNIHIFLYHPSPGERWQVVLEGKQLSDGWYHGWIERVVGCKKCQSVFEPAAVDRNFTTGTISNGQRTISVGAYDANGEIPAHSYFSSAGPTVDLRLKPDCMAPGVRIAAARSASFDDIRSPGKLCVKSGTSMAAPYVAGLCALIAQMAPNDIITHLKRMMSPFPGAAPDPYRTGQGILGFHNNLNIDNMENIFSKRADQESAEDILQRLTQKQLPARLDGGFLSGMRTADSPDGNTVLNVIGYPGQPLQQSVREGDIILRFAAGENLPLHASVVAHHDLVMTGTEHAGGFVLESDMPGAYVHVIEGGAFPAERMHRLARRLLERDGVLPAYQLVIRPAVPNHGESEEGLDEGADEGFGQGTDESFSDGEAFSEGEAFGEGNEEGFFDTLSQGVSGLVQGVTGLAQKAVSTVKDYFDPAPAAPAPSPSPSDGPSSPPAAPWTPPVTPSSPSETPSSPSGRPSSPSVPPPSSADQLLSDDYPVRQLTLNQARDLLHALSANPASGIQLDSPSFAAPLKVSSHRAWTRRVRGGPDVPIDETREVPRTYTVRPSTINGIDIKYMNTTTGGILPPNVNNLDPRMVVFLYKFTRWLRNTWGTDTLYHMGIGHGSGARFDCHNTGRALDLGGLKGVYNGNQYELFILRDWGRKPAKINDGHIYYRLSVSDGLVYSLFKDVYRYIVTQLSDTVHYYEGPRTGNDLDRRLFHDDVPIPSNFIIHPDHPDSGLRAAHINHIHCQVGPTSYEATPPVTVDSSSSQLEEGIGDVLHEYEQRLVSGLSDVYQGLSSWMGGSGGAATPGGGSATAPGGAAAPPSGSFANWPTDFGKGDSQYDQQAAAWIAANRTALTAFPHLVQVRYKSSTPNGYNYNGNSATDPVPDWKPADPSQAPIYEGIRRELFGEGGASSINTYDDQILTIGWGFSVKNELGRSVLAFDIQASAAFRDKLLSVGFYADATTVYYIDTVAGTLLTGDAALRKVKWDQKVLSQLIYAMEADNTINVASQVQVFKQYRMRTFPAEAFHWPVDSVRLAIHLSHWLPVGIKWAGIRSSGGDIPAIIKHFCHNIFDYQQRNHKPNYFLRISQLSNGALFVDDNNHRFHMGNDAMEKAGNAGAITTISPSAFGADYGADSRYAGYVFVSFKNKIYLLN